MSYLVLQISIAGNASKECRLEFDDRRYAEEAMASIQALIDAGDDSDDILETKDGDTYSPSEITGMTIEDITRRPPAIFRKRKRDQKDRPKPAKVPK